MRALSIDAVVGLWKNSSRIFSIRGDAARDWTRASMI
jgi:hypothetical protein|tara:strand:+ start:2837 stop:2947 length:111 start_codon:yes stop_codon:yes gene_type:complete